MILKIHLQQKLANIFHQVFQCLKDLHLEAQKISIGKDCMKKFCEFLREYAMKILNFNKRAAEII